MRFFMRKRVVIFMLVLLAVSGLLMACGGSGDKAKTPGVESGTYRHLASDGGVNFVTLYGGDDFTFTVGGAVKVGTYKLTGTALTLDFSDKNEPDIGAKLENDIISLNYGANAGISDFYRMVNRTVSFNSNQGSPISSVDVTNGETVSMPDEVPTREGYIFVGWYENAELTIPFAFDASIISKNTELHARWVAVDPAREDFTVKFDKNYEGATNDIAPMNTVGGRLYNLPTLSREGKIFRGWWLSMINDASWLSYHVNEDTLIEENATLYALWEDAASGGQRPNRPVAAVSDSEVKWEAIAGATAYKIIVKRSGEVIADTTVNSPATSFSLASVFTVAGEYEITVTAIGSSSSLVSDAANRVYIYKGLAKVSKFTIIEGSIVMFNSVRNATNYVLSVECGDANHQHAEINLGTKNYYNFSGCEMREEGISFSVRAEASGSEYMPSQSEPFSYIRKLDAVSGFAVTTNNSLTWKAVANATSYHVTVKKDGSNFDNRNVGNVTSYSIKEYDIGTYSVTVKPITAGYYSKESATTFEKKNLATPTEIGLSDGAITVQAVSGAKTYRINLGTAKTIDVTHDGASSIVRHELTASELLAIETLNSFDITVMAMSDNAAASLPSDPVRVQTGTNLNARYEKGQIRFDFILEASKYNIIVNGTQQALLTGINHATVELTQAGKNTITVQALNASDTVISGAVASVEVFANYIEFKSGDGATSVPTIYKVHGDLLNIEGMAAPVKAGYQFESWYTSPTTATSFNAKRFTDIYFEGRDTVLYAYFTSAKYTISLDAGEGAVVNPNPSVNYGQHFSLEVPNTEGNGFIGWFTEDGTQVTDAGGDSLAVWSVVDGDDTVLVAHYAEVFEFHAQNGYYTVNAGRDMNLVDVAIIPDTYNDLPVTHLYDMASNIKSLVLGKNITNIDAIALNSCGFLENIFVSEQNTVFADINGVLFNKAKTTLIRYPRNGAEVYGVPKGVTKIGAQAFELVHNLREISIGDSVTELDYFAFRNASNLSTVNMTRGLNTIGDGAFTGCSSLVTITIPADLSTIGDAAFDRCTNLETVIFDGTSTVPMYIEEAAFAGCYGITTLEFKEGSKVEYIGVSAFSGLANIETIMFPDSLKAIDNLAFSGASSLIGFTIGFTGNSLLESIAVDAFNGASSLKNVYFTSSTKITNFGTYFASNTSIEEIILPKGLTSVHANAFVGMTGLKRIAIPSALPNVNADLFRDCVSLEEFHITQESTVLYSVENGILYNNNLTKLIVYPRTKTGEYKIPGSLTSIESGAFRGADKITSFNAAENPNFDTATGALIGNSGKNLIMFPSTNAATSYAVPESVVTIEAFAFDNCTNLELITFSGANLKVISKYAFNNCTGLTSMALPSNLDHIGEYAFNGCSNLSTMNISVPEGAAVIGDNTFAGLTGLTSITIPSSITSIGANAFNGCTGLQTVIFDGDSQLESIGAGAFQNCISLQNIILPEGLLSIGDRAFENCSNAGFTTIEIPGSVTTLGNRAFYKANNVTSITFKGGATEPLVMGNEVFYQITALQSVTFESTSKVSNIGDYAFYGCANPAFDTIDIPSSVKSIGNYAFSKCIREEKISGSTTTANYFGLTNLKLNEGLVSIGNFAFSETLITNLSIPSTVQTIGDSAFLAGAFTIYVMNPTRLATIEFKGANEGTSKLKSIGAKAFYDNYYLSEVTFPSSLENIGAQAFRNTYNSLANPSGGLKTILFIDNDQNVSKLESIGNYAFAESNIQGTDLTLPRSLRIIGTSAFSDSNGSFSGTLTLGDQIETIGAFAFQNSGFTDIILPANITLIESSTFQGLRFTSIVIPSKVTEIGANAFAAPTNHSGNRTIEFEAGSMLSTVGTDAFSGAKIVINMPELFNMSLIPTVFGEKVESYEVTQSTIYSSRDGHLYDLSGKTLLAYPFGKSGAVEILAETEGIGNNVFKNSTITTITIPATVKSIGSGAFRDSHKLTKVTFEDTVDNPSQLQIINTYAFASCTTLEGTLTLPHSVTTIATSAFSQSYNISNIVFPDKLAVLGSNAFSGLNNIQTINVTENSINYKQNNGIVYDKRDNSIVLTSKQVKGALVLEDGLLTIPASAFNGNRNITSVFIPSSVTSIGAYAFNDCSGITTVTFGAGSNLKTIGDSGFFGCTSLANLQLPSGIQSIGEGAFQSLSSLTNEEHGGKLVIPSSLNSLGNRAFNSFKVKYLEFEAGSRLVTIGTSAFANNGNLLSVEFKGSAQLKTIGESAFNGNYYLQSINIPASVSEISLAAFTGCRRLTTISVDINNSNYLSEDNILFNKTKDSLILFPRNREGSYSIPTSVKRLENDAFSDSKISTIILNNVEVLGERVFKNCVNLSNFYLNDKITEIPNHAFQNCYNLGALILPSTIVSIKSTAFYLETSVPGHVGNPQTLSRLTLYAEPATSTVVADTWLMGDVRPIFYGCVLSSDKTYVVSWTKALRTFVAKAGVTLTPPSHRTDTFTNWNTNPDGSGTTHTLTTSTQVTALANNTVLYPIYN